SSQKFSNIISVIRQPFTNTVSIIMNSEGYTLDQMCTIISIEILKLKVGKLGSNTIKSFYNRVNIKSENLEKI
ncbi:4526_t:CDS:1, partial [Funneliformis geosporum]